MAKECAGRESQTKANGEDKTPVAAVVATPKRQQPLQLSSGRALFPPSTPSTSHSSIMPFGSSSGRRRRLPPSLVCQMPTSARKAPEKAVRQQPGITMSTGSFYGSATKCWYEKKMENNSKVKELDTSATFSPSENQSDSKETPTTKKAATTSKKDKKRKRSLERTVVHRRRSGSVTRRSGSTGRSDKRRRVIAGSFSINYGVSHSITKPKKTKKAAAEKPATPKTPKAKTSVSKPTKLFSVAPGKVGSLTPTVTYVIRNGQYHFVRTRRSPRKQSTEPQASTSDDK